MMLSYSHAQHYQECFFYRTTKEWNELPPSSYEKLLGQHLKVNLYYWMYISTLLPFQYNIIIIIIIKAQYHVDGEVKRSQTLGLEAKLVHHCLALASILFMQ